MGLSRTTNGMLSMALSGVAAIFYLVPMSSSGEDENSIMAAPWYYLEGSGFKAYYGIDASVIEAGSTTTVYLYEDYKDDSTDSMGCFAVSKTTLGFCTLAFLVTCLAVLLGFMRFARESPDYKMWSIQASFFAMMCGFVGAGTNLDVCRTILQDSDSDTETKFAAMAILAAIINMVVALLNLATPIVVTN